MKLLKKYFIKLDKIVGQTLYIFCILCFTGLFLVIALDVLMRFVHIFPMGWSSDVIEFFFVWLVFMGAASLWRGNKHFYVPFIFQKIKNKELNIEQVVTIIINILSLLFLSIMVYYGLKLTLFANDLTPTLRISKRFFYISIPLAGLIMISYTIYNVIQNIKIILYGKRKEKLKQEANEVM